MTMKSILVAIAMAVATAASLPAHGQAAPARGKAWESWPARTPQKLTISGQRVAKPELAYSLMPWVMDIRDGNAALKYFAAATEAPVLTEEDNAMLTQALAATLESLDGKEPRLAEVLQKFQPSQELLAQGARIDSVNWQENVREQGEKAIIPSLSKLRQMANALAVGARLDIQRHDWAAAHEKLTTGYRLAQHLGQGETLIESLVGTAIAGRMNLVVEDWISEPGAPNLYWALTELPTPLNDVRRPMRYEMAFIWASVPGLVQMRNGQFSADLWNRMMTDLLGLVKSGEQQEPMKTLAGPMLGIGIYPEAKRFLQERGMSAAELDKMPVPEVLGRYMVRSFEEDQTDVFKWMLLPPPAAMKGLQQWEKELQERSAQGKVNPFVARYMPALSRGIEVLAKQDRQLAILRVVEATRAYAAESGKLPDSLGALSLPIPADPMGGDFHYQKDGDTAVIWADAPRQPDALRYEITLRK